MVDYKVPKISVIMPVYNTAQYIKESIDSILAQSFPDFELIIFNDGSTDNSSEIIESIKDERIRFYNYQDNKGYVHLLNDGLLLAKGEYIARMDSDDISLPNRFAEQVALLDNNPDIGLCGTSFLAFGSYDFIAEMPRTDLEIREMMLTSNPIGHPTVMMRKSIIEKYKLSYKVHSMPVEDYFMWYDFSKVTKMYNISSILLKYRRHENQVSMVKIERQRIKVNEIRLIQLLEKGFILKEKERDIYCAILDNALSLDLNQNFKTFIDVLTNLINQNRVLGAYREQVFINIFVTHYITLSSKMKRFCFDYAKHLLLQSDSLYKALPSALLIKFILKSLIGWNIKK